MDFLSLFRLSFLLFDYWFFDFFFDLFYFDFRVLLRLRLFWLLFLRFGLMPLLFLFNYWN